MDEFMRAVQADLVSAENDGDGLAHTHDIPVPVGDVLVRHARSHVEHDDGAVALNVIACAKEQEISQTGKDNEAVALEEG